MAKVKAERPAKRAKKSATPKSATESLADRIAAREFVREASRKSNATTGCRFSARIKTSAFICFATRPRLAFGAITSILAAPSMR